MTLRNILFSVAAACAMAQVGCYGDAYYSTSGGYVAYDDPPPVREEVVTYRPGYVFVRGHWWRDRDRWAWRSGYYTRERPGYVWYDGRWERHGRRHIWREGGWRERGIIGRR